jgi:ribonuclease-3
MDVRDIEERLGHRFANPVLLTTALTHASLVREIRTTGPDNQRLEYLGDAVLQLAITEMLYHRYPELPEGDLTKIRATVVNWQPLQAAAERLGLGAALRLGRGEEKTDGRTKANILADAMEAVLGAVYLDAGWETARRFVEAHFSDALTVAAAAPRGGNAKGALQERLQSDGSEPPEYVCLKESGPPHAPEYLVAVNHDGKELARGTGRSKKEAEINAARAALEALPPIP